MSLDTNLKILSVLKRARLIINSLSYINYLYSDLLIIVEVLYLLNTYFKNILFLKEIVINFKIYFKQNSSNNLIKKIYNYRWTVKIIELSKKI